MVERTFRYLDLRFEEAAEETPVINELRRTVTGPGSTLEGAFPTKPRRQVRFHTFNLQLEIEALTGADRSALASEVV